MKVTEHDAVPVVAPEASVHGLPTKEPVTPDTANVTVPVGVVTPDVDVSVTVAVHVVGWLTTIVVGEQATVVVVWGWNTVNVVDPLLPLWFASPPYVAVTVVVPSTEPVSETEHDADVPVPASVHVPLGVNVTVPVGVLAVPSSLSVTVAVHVVD